ncbi:MAG: hypothetical protein KDK44_01465, partial [Chlamydiia bacterium]|nr:hypothetical protein [Chlamydiia bacterium]
EALFYRKLDCEQTKQKLIANPTQQIHTLEKKDLEALLTSRLEGLATSQLNHLSDNKKAFLSTAKENLLARVILSHAKQLLSELEKAADDAEFQKVKATYIAKAEKNNRFLLYYLRWSKASANLKLIPDKRTRLEAIRQFLEAKEELLKLKIAELPKTRPGRKNRVYWSALLNGEEVILREDQLQFIPAGNRSEALKRQKAAVKATAITGFFGKATESFLTGATSINPADLISISNPIIDNLSQFGMPVVMGGMELTKLLPDDDARFASLKKMGAQAEDPTGNGVKDLTPKDRALLSSQIVHCAQIIHHYKSYYDMKTFTIPRDRTVKGDKPAMASTVPLFEKNKKGEPLAGKFITDQYGKPVLGLVCEALIDELGIRGANAQEKHANLEMVVTHTLGESLEQRARRKANKKIALAKAKTETQKTKVQRKFKTPQNETKYILGNLKYKMDLITPLTVYERKNEQRQPITSRVSFTPISEAEGKELSAKVENPILIFSAIGAHRSLIKHQLAELDLAC